MTTNPPIIDEAELILRELSNELASVRDGECLCCYVWRQLQISPCKGTHRYALRFRDAAAPRATALRARLTRYGSCCCDCELFQRAFIPHPKLWIPVREFDDQDGITVITDAAPPAELPDCAGVRRGSIQACGNWVSQRRW
jgi:hypothetical protein